MQQKFLALALTVVLALGAGFCPPVQAGMVVVDSMNLIQNTTAAIESVTQRIKQAEQYRIQLEQYKNQIQNTLAPAEHIWDQARTTIGELIKSGNTLEHYKNQLGSLDNYLGRFQDVNYYKNLPCFAASGCTAAEWAAIKNLQQFASETQKNATDALFKGLDRQLDNLQNDAATLQRLQSAAQGATGQMQALGYASQLASQQSNQLLQMRALMIAQNNALATKMQAEADKLAQETAAALHLRENRYRASSKRAW
ncbi:P-type conjugative transfer protein TrbJ [Verminephrobacter aporrectodeae subsp. tuberculatae]|uniref:P-type conjugative transfer protein TrbJ n=1 Tax=Verminephrobacter aporrectodeae TaxID=1110389 RepID=UPI002236F49F|nr:P-type conjugative transfer protein TrbJ [Verminephrobacter aporrectodeae]MCW5222901.1 P-type conjugative transfer protein TrbJ [Verminephrobacter aporrectodeae subsp. tuberculatae]MCW5288365.1 P-type conjugative transfer protein TrbJ [Verminephrobacter aporrectodeae subsp. tuberculatae]